MAGTAGSVDAVERHRIDGIVLALADAFIGRSATIAAPASYAAILSARLKRYGLLVVGESARAEALVVSELSSLDGIGAVRAALDRLPLDGVAIAGFSLDGFPSHYRESISATLGARWPDLVFRVVDHGREAVRQGLTPWVAVRRRLPRAWLLLGAPNIGKTSAVHDLSLRTGLPVIHGDTLLAQVQSGEVQVSPVLRTAALKARDLGEWLPYVEALFLYGMFDELAASVAAHVGPQDFVLEMWAPAEHRHLVAPAFERLGYFPFMPQADVLSELAAKQAEIEALRASRSWRITAPLRGMARWLGRRRPNSTVTNL